MLFGNQNWRAGMQEVAEAIDDTMGERVLVTPAVAPKFNFPTVADPSRSVATVAVFTNKAKTVVHLRIPKGDHRDQASRLKRQ